MDEELLVLRTDWATDSDGVRLEACLHAHLVRERAHARARVTVRLWLVVSAVVWLTARWPGLLATTWREPVMLVWLAAAVVALGLSLAERYWNERLEQRVARLETGEAPRSR